MTPTPDSHRSNVDKNPTPATAMNHNRAETLLNPYTARDVVPDKSDRDMKKAGAHPWEGSGTMPQTSPHPV
eukprot:5159250-Amphidinium_carterae.2